MSEQKNRTIASVVSGYGKRLFRFVRGRVDTNEDAEDIVQEVWYQLSRLTNLDDLERVGSWLYRVARNKITDRYRKKSTAALEDFAYEDEEGDLYFKEVLLMDDRGDPEMALFKEIFWEAFLAALEELPEPQKMVFVQHELEDRTLQEIADQSGENLKTIISRKGYAVKHLRQRLEYLYRELNF